MSGNEKENVMMFDLCGACGEGRMRTDPGTGETRCGNCFAHPPLPTHPPLVMGGQGRSAEEVESVAFVLVLVVAAFVAAVLVVAFVAIIVAALSGPLS